MVPYYSTILTDVENEERFLIKLSWLPLGEQL